MHGDKLKGDAVNKNYVLGCNAESNFKWSRESRDQPFQLAQDYPGFSTESPTFQEASLFQAKQDSYSL